MEVIDTMIEESQREIAAAFKQIDETIKATGEVICRLMAASAKAAEMKDENERLDDMDEDNEYNL